jgi:TolB-like protein
MASLIPGYEYDIFISYRQKDNKHDGWVTKFVENIKGELESTFKEDISIYFDENPHDRLQETHNVDKSLEGKLKCLIFIPILSQTYCDPNSYAWQYEFLTFLRMAEQDCFGKDVKLRSGNVASRILPIRIHDLEPEDVKLFEKETGSVLRAMDFVFKTSSGVNRPLKANEDHPQDNLNKTFYSDQINKAANAIKEIILGLKTEQNIPEKGKPIKTEQINEADKEARDERGIKPSQPPRFKILSEIIGIAVLLVIIALLAYPRIFFAGKNKITRDPDGRISIAVNTFDNLTGDTLLNSWRLGISELLIYNLGTSRELSVQNSQTMSEVYRSMGQTQIASMVPTVSREAAMKLKAGTYITGNYQKTGNKIRIIVKLFDTKTDELLWTGKVDGNINADYIDLADSLSIEVKNFLEIKALGKNASRDFRDAYTGSSEAYRKYIEGMQSFMNSDYPGAIKSLQEAYRIDTTFTLAAFYIANANNIISTNSLDPLYTEQAIIWIQKAYKGKQRLPDNYQEWVEMWYAWYVSKNSEDVLNYCNLLEKHDVKSRYYWYDIGVTYISGFEMWPKAVSAFEKIEALDSEWGEDWKYRNYYVYYALSCHSSGMHEKEAKIYEKGLMLFPDWYQFIYGQARCAIMRGDTAKATELINKRIKLAREAGYTESRIETVLGSMYDDAKSFDLAELHYRRALQLDPGNHDWMINLAGFLIYNDRNISEGMHLAENALKTDPEGFFPLWCKGYGLYKTGKFNESLDYLIKAQNTYQSINPLLEKQIQIVRDSIKNQK